MHHLRRILHQPNPLTNPSYNPEEALTKEQRQLLLVLLEQEQIWHDGNLLGLFRAYGLPGDRKQMAAYLGQEAPIEAPREPLSRPQRPSQFDLYRETIQAIYPQLSLGYWGEDPDWGGSR